MSDYLEDFLDWLDRFINHEKLLTNYHSNDQHFSLKLPNSLAAAFGHPERSLKLVHVAGSKGKGSTSALLASILDAATNRPVGIYASPHVYDFRERIRSSRGFLSDIIYQKSIAEIKSVVTPDAFPGISWYEIVTIFAFLCFKNAGFEYAVVETGLGGRLDATNIITPVLSVITPIELEHTKILGDTLEQIAREKAGIIKPNVPVLIAPQPKDSVDEVFRHRAKELNSPIYFASDLATINHLTYQTDPPRMLVDLNSSFWSDPLPIQLQLFGAKQSDNAAVAAIAGRLLLPHITQNVISKGLARVTLPGRFELRNHLILDGAHTPISIAQSLDVITKLYPDLRPNLLFACAADKDIMKIAQLFRNRVSKIFLTIPGTFKTANLPAMEQAFAAQGLSYISGSDYREIIQQALSASVDTPLLITGSFYLIDETDKIISQLNTATS